MTRSNSELVAAFVNGETSGRASNMKIVDGPVEYNGTKVQEGETGLVGYGWALYARRSANGRVTVFDGWRQWADDKPGHSGQATIQHFSLLSAKTGPTAILSDRNPQVDDKPRSARTVESPRV